MNGQSKRHRLTEWVIGFVISVNPVIGLAIYAKYLEKIAKEGQENAESETN